MEAQVHFHGQPGLMSSEGSGGVVKTKNQIYVFSFLAEIAPDKMHTQEGHSRVCLFSG